MLTYQEFKRKHDASPAFKQLPKSEKKRRFQQYLSSPNPAYAAGSKSTPKTIPGKPSGGTAKGKSKALQLAGLRGYTLSPRIHDFLTARFNPFCPRINNVGYPDGVPGGTVKFRSFARGTGACNNNGQGVVMLSSLQAMIGLPYIQLSLAAYTGVNPAFPISSAVPGLLTLTTTGVPFTSNASTTGMVRMVSCGFRVRMTNAVLFRSGSIISYNSPYVDSDIFTATSQNILTYSSKTTGWYDVATADAPWYSCVWSPTISSEQALAYLPVAASSSVCQYAEGVWCNYQSIFAGSSNNDYNMGMLLMGMPNATFDFEFVAFGEYYAPPPVIGGLPSNSGVYQSMATPAYSDPLGKAIVSASNSQLVVNAMDKNSEGAVNLSSIVDTVSSAARSVLGNSSPTDMLSSLIGAQSATGPTEAMAVTNEPSLNGYISDSNAGVVSDLESRFFALSGREVGSGVSEESIMEALPNVAMLLA